MKHFFKQTLKWTLRVKKVDGEGEEFIYKARWNLRGDPQETHWDLNQEEIYLYILVAAQECMRMLYALATSLDIHLEVCNISNACVHRDMDMPILMEQPTDSSRIQKMPWHVCILRKSLYGAR